MKGKIDEEIVESLNIPIYYASPRELEEIVDKIGCFTIERMEGLGHIAEPETKYAARRLVMGIRVGVEGVFKGLLEDQMIDELFESYSKRLEQQPSMYSSGGAAILYSTTNCLPQSVGGEPNRFGEDRNWRRRAGGEYE